MGIASVGRQLKLRPSECAPRRARGVGNNTAPVTSDSERRLRWPVLARICAGHLELARLCMVHHCPKGVGRASAALSAGPAPPSSAVDSYGWHWWRGKYSSSSYAIALGVGSNSGRGPHFVMDVTWYTDQLNINKIKLLNVY